MMKVNRLVDVKVECDVSRGLSWYRVNDLAYRAKQMESLVSEFNDFVRDHRSMDWVELSVAREFNDVCEFCDYKWECDENGCPVCCDKAIKEFENSNYTEKVNSTDIESVSTQPTKNEPNEQGEV